jgi:hypothetical protein
MRLDLASLSPAEHSALSAVTGGSSADETTDALVLTVVVGLVLRSLPIVEADLESLRIDPALLKGQWLRELDRALKQAVAAALAGSGYAAARTLFEARSRYLFAPMADLNREARAAQPPPASSAKAAAPATAEATERPDPAPLHRQGRAPARAGRRPPPKLPRVGQVAVLALVVAVGIGLHAWKSRTAGSVEVLSKSELQLVSPQLDSGYRDRHGSGPLFIGTVSPGWKALPPAEREEKAKTLVKRLTESGVRQVMLFDRAHRLEVQYSAGQPVQVLR